MEARNIFLSYASGDFIHARNELCQSALRAGFDEARPRGPENLDSNFIDTHHAILTQSRGGGYWLWKPKIILQELRTLLPGDLLVYSDAGRSDYYKLKHFPTKLATLARSNKFLLGPTIGQHGPMSQWTKRDAFILLDMDHPNIHALPPIQATWSFWTPSPKTFEFLEAWLLACSDQRMLTDIENTQGHQNLPKFKDHRHDQAIMSLLAHKLGAPYLDYHQHPIQKIFRLRPQSRLSHLFLKRIEDAEALEKGNLLFGLLRSFRDI